MHIHRLSTRARATMLTAVVGVGALVAACGDSDGQTAAPAPASIASASQWCAAAEEVTGLLDDPSLETAALPELQDAARQAQALVLELQDGIAHARPVARRDAPALLAALGDTLAAVADAPDREGAVAAASAMFASEDPALDAGALALRVSCPGLD